MSLQSSSKTSLTPQAKRALKSVFLVLFLDLIGFSIIFPLFPHLLEHYVALEGQSGLLGIFLGWIHDFENWVGGGSVLGKGVPIILFGGMLGSLYSLLQFLLTPFWGGLSDRYGRKPILLISLTGIVLSYVGWFFAGSFALLVFSRILGGIMSGNISTATAAVSDVTSEDNRSSGMAVIGVAFGMGFLFGPAIGGVLSLWDLSEIFPTWAAWGVNPFSLPAAFAFLLSLGNLLYVAFAFQETLPSELRGQGKSARTINPFAILETSSYPGVMLTIVSYFLFLTIFSGMEFSLTFLAVERLGFRPLDNGIMFIFIGVVLSVVQGGYVRRKAPLIGEKKLSLVGMVLIMPGLVLIGFSQQVWMLYLGLFFLAVGAAMITPCLTALASLYAPSTSQGRVLGIFRSMGALARVVGPVVACVLYWRLSPTLAYLLGAILLLIPLALGSRLPAVRVRK